MWFAKANKYRQTKTREIKQQRLHLNTTTEDKQYKRELSRLLHLGKALFAAVTAALTSVELDIATLPMTIESEGLIISRYSFVDGGTTSPFI